MFLMVIRNSCRFVLCSSEIHGQKVLVLGLHADHQKEDTRLEDLQTIENTLEEQLTEDCAQV